MHHMIMSKKIQIMVTSFFFFFPLSDIFFGFIALINLNKKFTIFFGTLLDSTTICHYKNAYGIIEVVERFHYRFVISHCVVFMFEMQIAWLIVFLYAIVPNLYKYILIYLISPTNIPLLGLEYFWSLYTLTPIMY